MGGGGGSPQPSTTTTQTSNIPEYARPYVETMLGATQQQLFNTTPNASGGVDITGVKPYVPYSENPQDYVAGFSPMQQQAQQGVAGMQLPGEYGQAAGLTGLASMGALGAGRNYQRMATNPYAVGAYMNPYIQEALQPQLNQLAEQGQIQAQQAAGQATGAGAFGGTRSALQQNLAQRNALMAQQAALGQGYNQAYNQAQQAMQYGAGLGLQGQQAAMQGAGQLANIGGQALQGQQGIFNLQNQFGQQQQQQQQNIINQAVQNYATAQQYPQQQLAFMNSMIRGLPLQTMTTQGYQAAPSPVSQIAGLGLAGAGMYNLMKAEGGVIKEKKYAAGGITSIDKKVLNDPLAFSAQQISQGIKNKSVTPMIGAIALNQIENAPRPTPVAPQGTILAGLEAAAQQVPGQGIPQLPSNLPAQNMAGGGIIAFADGDLVEDDDEAMGGMSREERAMFQQYLDQLGEGGSEFGINMTAPTGTGIRPEASAPSGIETLADRDRLHKHVLAKESGGRRYDKEGKLLTSEKGAQGEMQVMPFTQKDPGFGVKPAKDSSPDEMARVGRDYLDAMMQRYGDPKLAAIAYNMGPGRTDKWLASGKGIEALPAETRKYIVGLASGGEVKRFAGLEGSYVFEDLFGGEPYAEEKLPRNQRVGTKDVLNRSASTRPSIEDLLKKSPMSSSEAPTRAGSAVRNAVTKPTLGTLAVPAAVGYGGYQASDLAANILRNPEAQKALGGKNIMQGALSGDTALPAEIQKQADQSKPIAKWIPDWMLPKDLVEQRNMETATAKVKAEPQQTYGDQPGDFPTTLAEGQKQLDKYNGVPDTNTPAPAAEAEKPKTAEQDLADYLKEIRENISQQRQQDKNMALIAAGLGIAGGTSQHALTNIGQGGLKGVEAQLSAQKQQGDAEKALLGGYSALARANLYADARKEANLLGQQKVLAGQMQAREKEIQAGILQSMKVPSTDMLTKDQAAAYQNKLSSLLALDKDYNAIKRKLYSMQGIDTAGVLKFDAQGKQII